MARLAGRRLQGVVIGHRSSIPLNGRDTSHTAMRFSVPYTTRPNKFRYAFCVTHIWREMMQIREM